MQSSEVGIGNIVTHFISQFFLISISFQNYVSNSRTINRLGHRAFITRFFIPLVLPTYIPTYVQLYTYLYKVLQ